MRETATMDAAVEAGCFAYCAERMTGPFTDWREVRDHPNSANRDMVRATVRATIFAALPLLAEALVAKCPSFAPAYGGFMTNTPGGAWICADDVMSAAQRLARLTPPQDGGGA